MCKQKLNRHQSESDRSCKRHKWADVLIAIAEGREVQWNSDGQKWHDFDPARHNAPSLQYPFASIEWRVKPKTVRKYHYAFQLRGRYPAVTTAVYKDDEEFLEAIPSEYVWFQRLDNSCVELEES